MIGFGNMAEPDFCTHILAILPKSCRLQAALGTGASPSKRVCHTNAMLAPAPPQAALASYRGLGTTIFPVLFTAHHRETAKMV